jgi:Xaa-Pro dipeptidase
MFGGSKDVLRANMVMTIEPAVFIKEEGLGARLIDNCIIKDGGIELLSTTSRDIAIVD